MTTKQAVQISPRKRTKYIYQKIKMCKKCHRYSVLNEEECYKCGSTYTGIEKLVKTVFKNKLFTQAVLILIFVSLGIFLAPTLKDLYLSMTLGVLFCGGYVVLHLFFLKSEYMLQLQKLVKDDIVKILEGTIHDSALARDAIDEGLFASAYEKFREIGDFINNDAMKLNRVHVLNRISLRKDMDLELETLVPSFYNQSFTSYALEVLKVNKALATKNVFHYFIQNRDEIEQDFGTDALVSISIATLRMKLYILEYKGFIFEFLDQFPKDRLLRLCSIIDSNPTEDWGPIYDKTKSIVKMKYDFDPDFKSYF